MSAGDQDIIDTIAAAAHPWESYVADDGNKSVRSLEPPAIAANVFAALRERYVIVEPPKAGDDERWDIPSCGEFNGVQSMGDSCTSVEITEEGIDVDIFGPQTPLEARLLAAVLLAAADYAEENQ